MKKLKFSTKYAEFLTKRPYFSLLLLLIIFVAASILSSNVKTTEMDYSNLLPEDMDVIKANNILVDSFGGTDQALFVIELDENYFDSTAMKSRGDIRDPEVIKYIDLLTRASESIEGVSASSSASSVFRSMNEGAIPKTRPEIIYFYDNNPLISKYISDDFSMALVKLEVEDNADPEAVLEEMRNIIAQTPKPQGVTVDIAGQQVADVIIQEQIGPDMGRTSSISMVGIVIILFLMFWSIKYALTPMAALGIGITWAFGYIGLIGMNMNSATSGVISMIMGIGIDFGIQIVTRFRDELQNYKYDKAMIITLENVLLPMATTTIAALIGFKAMSMGELTLMKDMGTMMSYGITACFFSAITVVPVILIISERIKEKKETFRKMIGVKKKKAKKQTYKEKIQAKKSK
ncbi:MAG: MMPL family transporter [Candidatus Nanoarchaeia archaeon]